MEVGFLTDSVTRPSFDLGAVCQGLARAEVDEVGWVTGRGKQVSIVGRLKIAHVAEAAWPTATPLACPWPSDALPDWMFAGLSTAWDPP